MCAAWWSVAGGVMASGAVAQMCSVVASGAVAQMCSVLPAVSGWPAAGWPRCAATWPISVALRCQRMCKFDDYMTPGESSSMHPSYWLKALCSHK
ncbi:hypothetical protein C2845_PM09G12950 [Panicum miliaceum]|uniref:Secreted protein n=1 Tax=Panicum miliaceum TaxID=4540 RepID=A0A3L6RZM6_PANMI|nr:hypothetical protein C2845_PM09G12950 [Panicum miliaceum]